MCALWFFIFLTFYLLSCCSFIAFFKIPVYVLMLSPALNKTRHVPFPPIQILSADTMLDPHIFCGHSGCKSLFCCSKCNVIFIWPLAFFSFVSIQRWWFCSPAMTNSHSNFVYFFHFFLIILLSCSVLLMTYSLVHKWFVFWFLV